MIWILPGDDGASDQALSEGRERLARPFRAALPFGRLRGGRCGGEQGLRLDPKNSGAYTTLARALNHLQQTARAEQLDLQALKEVPKTDQILQQLIAFRFLQGDRAGGQKLADAAIGSQFEREALLEASNFAFADGRVKEAVRLVERANALGRLKKLQPDFARLAESYMWVGLDAPRAPPWPRSPPRFGMAATTITPRGSTSPLGPWRDCVETSPQNRTIRCSTATSRWKPGRRSCCGRENRSRRTGWLKASAASCGTTWMRPIFAACRGGQGRSGRGGGVPIHAGSDRVRLEPQYTLAHLGLARALRLKGDLVASRGEYQAFLAAWKDADADLPP